MKTSTLCVLTLVKQISNWKQVHSLFIQISWRKQARSVSWLLFYILEGKTSSICLLSCILFDIMPSHVLWCYFKSCHAMRCNVMSYDIMWYHVMSCLVMSCDGMWSEVMSCHLMSWHVMTLDVMECKQKN